MNILIDASAYILASRNHAGAARHFQEAADLYMNVVVLGELRFGYLKGTKREQNERHLQDFLSQRRVHVIGIDDDTTHFYARIRQDLSVVGKTLADNDLWIAASAMQHGLCILTADTDFQKIPQVMVELITSESV